MSKKSRKRNRRLLKAAALLGGLALAARGRGNQMSEKETVSDAQKSSQLGTLKKKPTKVYQDDIMRGGKGVQNMRKIPGIVVDKPIGSFPFLGLKKGGRVKKGFAKKKKQANKMRKK